MPLTHLVADRRWVFVLRLCAAGLAAQAGLFAAPAGAQQLPVACKADGAASAASPPRLNCVPPAAPARAAARTAKRETSPPLPETAASGVLRVYPARAFAALPGSGLWSTLSVEQKALWKDLILVKTPNQDLTTPQNKLTGMHLLQPFIVLTDRSPCPAATPDNSDTLYKLMEPAVKGAPPAALDAACSATLISGPMLVTAAHCVHGRTLSMLSAKVGQGWLPFTCKPHEKYDHKACEQDRQSCVDDLAVCRLPPGVEPAGGLPVVPVVDAQAPLAIGSVVQLAGFGLVAQSGGVPPLRGSYCSGDAEMIGSGAAADFLSTAQAVGNKPGQAFAWDGDSGGAVFWRLPGPPTTRVLVGVMVATNYVNRTWFVDLRHTRYKKLLAP